MWKGSGPGISGLHFHPTAASHLLSDLGKVTLGLSFLSCKIATLTSALPTVFQSKFKVNGGIVRSNAQAGLKSVPALFISNLAARKEEESRKALGLGSKRTPPNVPRTGVRHDVEQPGSRLRVEPLQE